MNEQKTRPVVTFLGIVLLLLGLYGSLRTVVNLVALDRYPQEGVFSTSVFQAGSAPPQREEDCATSYTYTAPLYYQPDGVTPRKATAAESESDASYKMQQEQSKQNCVSGIQEVRRTTMVNDISQSIIFLLLALGVLFYTRIFKTPITLKI